MQTQFKTAEEWQAYETQIAADPQNLALCVAHKNAETKDRAEFGLRLLAIRKVSRIKGTHEPQELKERQRLRFIFYARYLEFLRARCKKFKANRNYKTPHQRREARAWLLYIRECQRTGAAINYQSRPHGCD